jgi:hypothetical protein
MTLIDSQAFETWYDFHTKGDPVFEDSENENMEEILNFFSSYPTNPMDHFCVTLRDEYGIVLAIDKHLTNLTLLHKVEALPATRQNKTPVVRALYGFGKEAIPVLLEQSVLEVVTTAACPTVTAIRKAHRDGITDFKKLSLTSSYKGMSMIMLPPFIAKALLNLPTLAVDEALTAVLDAIATYEKENKLPPTTTPSASKPTLSPTPAPKAAPTITPAVETVDDIDSDEEYDILPKKPAAKETQVTVTKESSAPSAPSKKKASSPSTYTRCAQLLKFLSVAQYQQKHYEDIEDEILNGTILRPTQDLIHRQWAALQHVQMEINQPGSKDKGGALAKTDPMHLFDRVANPLNEIKESLESLMDKYQNPSITPVPSAETAKKTALKKLEEKFEPSQIEQFKRLSSTDGMNKREELEDFLIKFLTMKGMGGVAAAQLLSLNNKLKRRNINLPIGCVTAMHAGRFGWDHPTCPNNFSAFYTPRANALDMGKAQSAELLNVHLRAQVGKGIENGDINKITKQYMTVPGTVPDLIKQLDNHNKLQGDFWGTESMVFRECNRFIRGIDDYEASYESAHVADPMFLCKIMYYYDLTLYHLYDECLVKEEFLDIRWELADLQKCHTKVLQGQFFQTLPPVLSAPSKKRALEEISVDPKIRPPPIKNPKGPSLPNKDQHTILQLQNGEDFNNVVLRTQQMKLVPAFPGTKTSVCLNWHINGRCHENCERKGSHKSLANGTLKQMEAFLKACRVAHKKVDADKEKK